MSLGSARSRVGGGFGFANACSRIDGPVSAKRGPDWCGIAAMARRTAAATAADAIDSIGPSRGKIVRCPDAPSMSRITPTFSPQC